MGKPGPTSCRLAHSSAKPSPTCLTPSTSLHSTSSCPDSRSIAHKPTKNRDFIVYAMHKVDPSCTPRLLSCHLGLRFPSPPSSLPQVVTTANHPRRIHKHTYTHTHTHAHAQRKFTHTLHSISRISALLICHTLSAKVTYQQSSITRIEAASITPHQGPPGAGLLPEAEHNETRDHLPAPSSWPCPFSSTLTHSLVCAGCRDPLHVALTTSPICGPVFEPPSRTPSSSRPL
ncbi:unnamed protein product [Protopolystoma xenopodis]|uniref:Uncharacterized protein n=1 Tax=Protopolystoma xenopodis TaxID=117903 RepID=A0A3S5CLH3_9PLAT|nr:unnamed protein product [Protopolystoma xenopodis]